MLVGQAFAEKGSNTVASSSTPLEVLSTLEALT